jgi:hypothetical protein
MGESTFTRRGAGGSASVIKYTNGGTFVSTPQKQSNATSLSGVRTVLHSGALGTTFAVFAGGTNTSSAVNIVDAYNTSLTRTSPNTLSYSTQAAATSFNSNYFAIAGGYVSSFSSAVSTVNVFNTSFTRSTPTVLGEARWWSNGNGGCSVGDFLLFGGGTNTSGSSRPNVYAYDNSLTRSIPTQLSVARAAPATETTSHGLFVGGDQAGTVDVYNTSLTRSNPGNLPTTVGLHMAAAKVNNNALFAGGWNNTNGSLYTTVYSFNTSLTRSSLAALSQGRQMRYNGSSNYNKAMFSGGWNSANSTRSNVVDAYNTSLTKDSVSTLEAGRQDLAAAGIGEYHLIAGGNSGSVTDVVEVYSTTVGYILTTPELSNFTITYKYDFTNIGTGTASEGQTLSSSTAFTGTLEFPENIS